MKTKFKKGDRVRVTAATLQRWRKDDKRVGTLDPLRKYFSKVGEVVKTRSNPYPQPSIVEVRFKGIQDVHLLSTMLEHA